MMSILFLWLHLARALYVTVQVRLVDYMQFFFVSLFSLQCYRNRSKGVTETDLYLREKLTKLEKEMLENQELVEIRGKVSNLETIYLIFVKIQVHVSI